MRSDPTVTTWIALPLGACVLLALCVVALAMRLPASAVDALEDPVAPAPVERAHVQPETKPKQKPPRAPLTKVIPAELPLVLRGTLCDRDPLLSLAAVEGLDDGRARSIKLGDRIDGAEVVAIERTRVLFQRGEESVVEELVLGARPARGSSRPVARTDPPRADLAIRQRALGEFELSRQELSRLSEREDLRLIREVQVVPAFEAGRAVGFKFSRIAAGSVAERLGLRQGDVVRRVNGVALDSPERVLELYPQLRDATRIELEVGRGGGTTRLTYVLSP